VAHYGIRHMIGGLKFVNAGAFVGVCLLVYSTQKNIRKTDMAKKQERSLAVESDVRELNSAGNVTVQPRSTLYELGSR